MSRALTIIFAVSLAACSGPIGDTASSSTDPTIEFDIDPPQVDTAMPPYEGGRRRALDSGWRRMPTLTPKLRQ